jgi:chromosome segregation ATPase
MFEFLKKPQKKNFDRKVLRKNDISLLTLDERWNSLFTSTEKTPEIMKYEEELKELLKEQARLISEAKEISTRKKTCMDKIIQLTTEVFDNNNEKAKDEMQSCEKEIKRINERAVKIEERLEIIPDSIKEANLNLLETTVNIVYFKIRSNQKRVADLEKLIEDTRNSLKLYIDEKESLSQDDTDIYSYFHDLLGGEELEKLDKDFFGDK